MLRIEIEGVAPYDGSYDLDTGRVFNGHELHLIKQISGLRLGEIDDAAEAEDYDLVIALAVIVLWRHGKTDKKNAPLLAELLLGADGGKIKLTGVDASPPDETPSESNAEQNANSESSSPALNGTGDGLPETSPISTGVPS
jgi:hypothetical protein